VGQRAPVVEWSVGASPSFGERERDSKLGAGRGTVRVRGHWPVVGRSVGEGTVAEEGEIWENGGKKLDSEIEMSTHPRFQRLFLIFFFNKKRKKPCHVGQEPNTSRTLDTRIALLWFFSSRIPVRLQTLTVEIPTPHKPGLFPHWNLPFNPLKASFSFIKKYSQYRSQGSVLTMQAKQRL
jgi:hypothetical protein